MPADEADGIDLVSFAIILLSIGKVNIFCKMRESQKAALFLANIGTEDCFSCFHPQRK